MDDAIVVHDFVIRRYGGLPGFPNPGYLDSALAAPLNSLNYSDGGLDLFDLAAVYLYHVAKAHAFVDGNKRTGYIAALAFLHLNGIPVPRPEVPTLLAEAVVEAAKGEEFEKEQLAALMRKLYGVRKKRPRRK